MSVSIYNIKRWIKMLNGTSIYHVRQDLGRVFIPGKLNGYFNDMTQKVIMGETNIDDDGIPFLEHSDGSHVQMPTMIFQYGLGAYDLWLLEKEKIFLMKAVKCAEWGITHQLKNGAWNNFYYIYPNHPYSAMTQGEGISLLLRVYVETNDEKYLKAAQEAIKYMLTDVNQGGVTDYSDGRMILLEYTHLPVVLNGWIFALFGIYDMMLLQPQFESVFEQAISSLIKELPNYDCGFWSMYNNDGMITSPFYHRLHIAQLNALSMISSNDIILKYLNKFRKYERCSWNRRKAFIIKSYQKIMER